MNPARPAASLPYEGAWLMMGPEMVHLMEVPNPDPTHLQFRPQHGGEGGGTGSYSVPVHSFNQFNRPPSERPLTPGCAVSTWRDPEKRPDQRGVVP